MFLLCLVQVSCTTVSVESGAYRGEVTRVHDGDSIHLMPRGAEKLKIRLASIDAPELEQRFGRLSRDHLKTWLLNRQVEARCHTTDRYNRRVCTLYVGDTDVNLQMLKSGFAWHYKRFQEDQSIGERRRYAAAEAAAQTNRLGLWAESAVAPWEYRIQN